MLLGANPEENAPCIGSNVEPPAPAAAGCGSQFNLANASMSDFRIGLWGGGDGDRLPPRGMMATLSSLRELSGNRPLFMTTVATLPALRISELDRLKSQSESVSEAGLGGLEPEIPRRVLDLGLGAVGLRRWRWSTRSRSTSNVLRSMFWLVCACPPTTTTTTHTTPVCAGWQNR